MANHNIASPDNSYPSSKPAIDVFTLGNALVDYIYEGVQESFLSDNKLRSGDMHLVNPEAGILLDEKLASMKMIRLAGGSATNVACGVANLGGKSACSGCVGDDANGLFFQANLIASDVKPHLWKSEIPTGVARTFVTTRDDGRIERTFATSLGAAPTLPPQALPIDTIRTSRILHTTGYTYQAMSDTFAAALEIAVSAGTMVSLDLSSPSVIEEYRQQLMDLTLSKVDFLFMNEQESMTLSGTDNPLDSAQLLGDKIKFLIIKLGPDGARVFHEGKETVIEPFAATNVLDVNGAGDGFTAGFLYSFCRGLSLHTCGRVGAYYGARVVEHLGARLPFSPMSQVASIIAAEEKV
ncbi:MAG: hypothetical protein CVV64_07980 [Candidatus Wallbacteria bacterium HGW-Wallbacteria-1]|jgi:sugar/nucleoside kinase (ribokinase family)|uniref:Carbohydrate kinase PfkB domain-containing protein n=1 Tax=Candidatus Wallbacteria bacterium HGW-Wallbacteria-1 TaxID=2013854 RepID=A0A2N1PR37_9BACT|nr:MAG: hypothetical protein CVV64_07980 [Candidatus Wallbacteria bacterium HGW-Wallbacteria-1]